jgi:WD40 repeat protein
VSLGLVVFRFITGSYDRTCKVWDTQTGDELLTLEGHKNVVYAIAFNNPYGWVVRQSLGRVVLS